MDIRNYFGGGGFKSKESSTNGKPKSGRGSSNGKRKRSLDDDDEDFQDDKKAAKQSRGKTGRSKKSTIIYDSDSEDEAPSKKKKAPTPKKMKSPVVSPPSSKFKKQQKLKTPSPAKLKPTTVMDFFGASPVYRSNKKTPSSKRTKTEEPTEKKPKLVFEDEDHDDVQFIETLNQVDESNVTPKKSKREDQPSPFRRSQRSSSRNSSPARSESSVKSQDNTTSNGLASKLAAKVKASKTLIADTPEKSASRSPQKTAKVLVEDTPVRKEEKRTRTPIKEVKETPSRTTRSTPQKTSQSSSQPSSHKKTPQKTPQKSSQSSSQKTSQSSSHKRAPQKSSQPSRSPQKMNKSGDHVKSPQKTSPPAGATPTGDGEKRKGNAAYRSYLHREGPRALGTKDIPEGAEGCLEGLTFVITGVLDYVEKDEAKSLVERHGGRVTGSVSKKTTYLVVGRDAGESKMQKAQDLKVGLLNEDELFDLIKTRPGKKGKKPEAVKPSKNNASSKPKPKTFSSLPDLTKLKTESRRIDSPSTSRTATPPPGKSDAMETKSSSQSGESLMWVDKHKPDNTKLIIGQQGDKSPVAKLKKWLHRWQDNNYGVNKEKAKFNRDEGFCFKAALLSGPPGVGKTTSAELVCKEEGFLFLEMNASDARSKKSLDQVVAEYLHNNSIRSFFGSQKSQNVKAHKTCLLMDEVDGMAGNEDRGGIQELIQLIKNSQVPIICMCNDRSHPKMRSLVNYCFDLRFQRPRVKQIQGAMMKVAFKEGIKIPPASMENIIMAANHDVRQVLHNLSMWSAGQRQLSSEQLDTDANNAKKDLKLGPWDVLRKVFVSGEERAKMSFIDKMDLFFHDYSIAPLFVHENYMSVIPRRAKGKVTRQLDLISKAADSLCQADLVDKNIRSNMSWSLLPTMAVFSSVAPGEYMQGHVSGMINFPGWLGKNSTTGKNRRLLQELQMHMRVRTSTSIQDLNMGYIPHLRNFLTKPLQSGDTEGVPEVVQLLNDYDLTREDFDSIIEVGQFAGRKEPMSTVLTKVKSAFTRTYNKESHMVPYSQQQGTKKGKRGGKGGAGAEEGMLGEEGEGESQVDDEEADEEADLKALIKKKKGGKAASKSTTSGKGKAPAKSKAPAKGKGRGKGKSK